MKIFNLIFILLFIVFAALQYNDPDPYIWVTLYLFGALLCFLSLKRMYIRTLFYTGIVVYSLYALYLFFDKTGVLNWAVEHDAENIAASMKASRPWIEETREFFGLILLIVVMIINIRWLKGHLYQRA